MTRQIPEFSSHGVPLAVVGLDASMRTEAVPHEMQQVRPCLLKWTAKLRIAAAASPAAERWEPLLTAEQVAGRLQVSEAQVYRLAPVARSGGSGPEDENDLRPPTSALVSRN